jgi:DnaK suppressor protein
MSLESHPPLAENVLLLFKSGLREQHRELAHAIDKIQKEIHTLPDSEPGDAVDDSWGNSYKETMFASYSKFRMQLRKVELALERISTGDFGICDVCEGAIGLKRLQALPWATNCRECQEQSEQSRVH